MGAFCMQEAAWKEAGAFDGVNFMHHEVVERVHVMHGTPAGPRETLERMRIVAVAHRQSIRSPNAKRQEISTFGYVIFRIGPVYNS